MSIYYNSYVVGYILKYIRSNGYSNYITKEDGSRQVRFTDKINSIIISMQRVSFIGATEYWKFVVKNLYYLSVI